MKYKTNTWSAQNILTEISFLCFVPSAQFFHSGKSYIIILYSLHLPLLLVLFSFFMEFYIGRKNFLLLAVSEFVEILIIFFGDIVF